MMNDAFAPPPFQPEAALAGLKRRLRELKLLEREGRFEWQGRPVAELALDGGSIRARSVKQPSRSPEWTSRLLANHADVRKFVEDLERQCARWGDRDE